MKLTYGSSSFKVGNKDYFPHSIIFGSIIVVLLVLYGFYSTVTGILTQPKCALCITVIDNGKTIPLLRDTKATIELDNTLYPKENLFIVSNPEGSLETSLAQANDHDNWAVLIKSVGKGSTEITVRSTDRTKKDFHIILNTQ